MEWWLRTDVFLSVCPCFFARSLPLVNFLLHSPGSRDDLPGCTHLLFLLTSTFLACSFRNWEMHIFPKKGGEGEGAKIGRKPCKKMSLTDFFSSGFLSSCSLNLSEKPQALPPRWIKSLRPLSEKRGDTHHFSLQIIRGRSMQTEPRHKSLSSNYWREIKLMLEALRWVG